MATTQATVDYILDQVSSIETVTARKMFGEYVLYAEGKVVALVCDDMLFVKPTPEGRAFIGSELEEGIAYPGAKPSFKINEERIENREWLTELVRITAGALPAPVRRIKRSR